MDSSKKSSEDVLKLLLKTKLLSIVALLTVGVAIWDAQPKSTVRSALPTIEALTKNDIQRVELTSMGNTITLEQQNGQWVEVAPISGLADVARINAMILNFRKPISMDVLVESSPANGGKEYGLDSSNAITVEMWGVGDTEPSISFLLGKDTEQGASFVRLSGNPAVYRAHIGGRRRFVHPAGDWLNQRVLQWEMSDLSTVSVSGPSIESYTLRNGSAWSLDGVQTPVDVKRLSQALQTLLQMRIGENPESTLGNLWMTIVLQGKDGTQQTLKVAEGVERQTHIDLDGKIYRVPLLPFERFVNGARYFMDKRVFPIRSRDELDLIRYKTDLNEIIIQQDLSNGFWNVLQPSNVDLEMRDVFFMVNTLVSLSSLQEVSLDEWDASIQSTQSAKPKVTLEMRRLQGDVFRLHILEARETSAGIGYLCHVEGMESGFIASKEDIEQIVNGFGQSNVF